MNPNVEFRNIKERLGKLESDGSKSESAVSFVIESRLKAIEARLDELETPKPRKKRASKRPEV